MVLVWFDCFCFEFLEDRKVSSLFTFIVYVFILKKQTVYSFNCLLPLQVKITPSSLSVRVCNITFTLNYFSKDRTKVFEEILEF